LPSATNRTLGKEVIKKISLTNAMALNKDFIKKLFLYRVPETGHSAKNLLKKILCRVPDGGHSAKTDNRHLQLSLPSVGLCRVSVSRYRLSLPSAGLC